MIRTAILEQQCAMTAALPHRYGSTAQAELTEWIAYGVGLRREGGMSQGVLVPESGAFLWCDFLQTPRTSLQSQHGGVIQR